METGREMQSQYLASLRSIFEEAWTTQPNMPAAAKKAPGKASGARKNAGAKKPSGARKNAGSRKPGGSKP